MAKKEKDANAIRQQKAIKQRLIDYFDKLKDSQGLTYASVQLQLRNSTDGFDVSYTALHDVLTLNDKAPNMCIVLGLCRLWHLDYALVFAPPEQDVTLASSDKAFEEKVKVLKDPKYLGTYYGYKYTRNHDKDEIESFELVMKEQGNSTEARMITHSRPSRVGGEKGNYSNTYIGTPYLVTKSGTVTMTLINDDGDFCTIFFDYRTYGYEKLYFRKGIVVSAESNNTKPYLMNFLLFQRPVSKEKQQKYFPGMLKLIENGFYVPKGEVDSLLKDDDFSRCMSKYCPHLEDRERNLYFFKVSSILDNLDDNRNTNEVNEAMRFIFQLQGKATTLSAIEYDNPKGLPGFAKTYLQVDSV